MFIRLKNNLNACLQGKLNVNYFSLRGFKSRDCFKSIQTLKDFLNNLFLSNFRFTQLPNIVRIISYALHPVPPTVNISYNHDIVIKAKKLI